MTAELAGTREALRDLDREIATFATDHYAEIRDEANVQARAAAERVDAALEALVAAYGERESVAAANVELYALVARPGPNTIPRARPQTEQAVRAAESALMAGAERPPGLPASHLPRDAEVAQPMISEAF